jgi:hypothetical protein
MTREQVKLFITKTHTDYRDLNPGPLVSKSGPRTTGPAGRIILRPTIYFLFNSSFFFLIFRRFF